MASGPGRYAHRLPADDRGRAVERGELPGDADAELLSQLPLSLLQNWRLEHDREPDEAVVERIVRQFYSPAPRRGGGPAAPLGTAPESGRTRVIQARG